MRRVSWVVSGLLLLCVACARPRIDTSTDETMKKTIARVRESLPENRRAEFDGALTAVLASQFNLGNIFAGAAGVGSMESGIKTALHGKTADEVIAYADTIKKQREAKEREQALGEIKELESKRARAEEAKKSLVAFEVSRSRFYKKRGYLRDEPIIELTVKNGTPRPVARAYFRGTLASPGRAVPWLRETFNYQVRGGLEPGESATWHLAPNTFSEWGRVQVPADAVFTVDVVRLDGPNDEKLFDSDEFSERDSKRLAELKKAPSGH